MDWHSIRTENGTRNNAFESLVCQLAKHEPIPNKVDFVRLAPPDGGVEAYCTLSDGCEYGWQAKYFFSLGEAQLNELDQSVKRMLCTHPNMVKYYICIPIDRNDARIPNRKSALDRWYARVDKWKGWAAEEKRDLEFVYWGDFELTERLSLEVHAGRRNYWFSGDEYTNAWFARNAQRSINDLGSRYSPELNVDIEISRYFDYASRSDAFRDDVKKNFNSMAVALTKVIDSIHNCELSSQKAELACIKTELLELCSILTNSDMLSTVNKKSVASTLDRLDTQLVMFDEYYKDKKGDTGDGAILYSQWYINKLHIASREFRMYIESDLFSASENPICILSGVAGVGKSHIIAHAVEMRLCNNKACLFLLGSYFQTREDPIIQILRQLQVNCGQNEFFSALNEKAETQQERVVIFIDAINEGSGKYVWRDYIRGLISLIKQYKWLGLILSVRDSYEDVTGVRSLVDESSVVYIKHTGFEMIEDKASSLFFVHYHIQEPAVPLLTPEFGNPLFLKLFCEGLHNKGITVVPKGTFGLSFVFNAYIDSIEQKLSRPTEYDYPSNLGLVEKCRDRIIQDRVIHDTTYITYSHAVELIDQVVKPYNITAHKFLGSLISEGLYGILPQGTDNKEDLVYTTYERMDEYYLAEYLVNINSKDITSGQAFKPNGSMEKYVKESDYYQGINEAFFIILSEKYGFELMDLVDALQRGHSLTEAFVGSLVWRVPDAITRNTTQFVNEYAMKWNGTWDRFLNVLFEVALDPEHPYNADTMHKWLMAPSMSDRDAFWVPFIRTNAIYSNQPISRLVKWAERIVPKSDQDIPNKVRLLACSALAWLLATTTLDLRDRVTYAIRNLLVDHLDVARDVFNRFIEVNDPYVVERVTAAIYGAILCSSSIAGVSELAQDIVDKVFANNDEVYTHILARDYMRNIVEYALTFCSGFSMANPEIIRPPYKSSLISSFPANEQVDKYKFNYNDKNFKPIYWAQNDILSSMITEYGRGTGAYGDFGRYVFQAAFSEWSQVDVNGLSNYACSMIFNKYKYDVRKHGSFDRQATSVDRFTNRHERIGKKYQWIALWSCLLELAIIIQ